jgi:hypothetical protein
MATAAIARIWPGRREDQRAGGAEALEGGDDAALAVEIGAHGIGDADAAHHQRRQPDQREELREPLDIGGQRRRGVGAAANAPAGFGNSAVGALADRSMSASLVPDRQPIL